MTQKKESSYLKGAMILVIASILVKAIGAIFRIPLTRTVGDYSMGLYSAAYRYYTILLTIATAGLPIAISKMISESRALGRYSEARRIFKIALLTCVGLGVFGTLFMMSFSGPLADIANNREIMVSILTLAPAVLFIAVTAAFRGYFQGHGNMVPTALSQVTEALSRLFIGLVLAVLLIHMGWDDKYVSAGAICGVTIGTLLAALLMISIYVFRRKRAVAEADQTDVPVRSSKRLFRDLMLIAVPVTVGALVMNLTNFIDLLLVTNRLAALGYDSYRTTELFGIYDNYAVPLFNLVPSVIISLNVSITPVIAAAYARKNMEELQQVLTSALRLVVIFAVPAAVGISVLSNPILTLLFGAGDSAGIATPVLSIMSAASVFLCISSLSSTVLQALGKANVPLCTMAVGAVVKIIANYVLIAIPGIELNGAAIGTVLCYAIIAVLNLIYLARFIDFKPNFFKTYLKPLLSSIVMGGLCFMIYYFGRPVIGMIPAVAVSILVSAAVYLLLLYKLGGITTEDVLLLPKGQKIAAILDRRK